MAGGRGIGLSHRALAHIVYIRGVMRYANVVPPRIHAGSSRRGKSTQDTEPALPLKVSTDLHALLTDTHGPSG